MNKECQKEIFKWVLVILGFILISFTIFLYTGDNLMKSCCIMKIICSGLLAVVLIGGIIGIWCCKGEVCCQSANFSKNTRNYIFEYENGVCIVRKGTGFYTVYQYDSLDKAFLNVQNNDILIIFDSEIKITEQELGILYAKREEVKNINIRFVTTESINTIKLKS